MRPGTVSALKKRGLIRVGIFGRFRAGPGTFACYSFLKELPQKSFDFILVTTKSFDSKSAAYDIKRHRFLFTERTKIVLCQNGWGNAETFSKLFPKKQICNARIITGFIRPKLNTVKITVHADRILIGSPFQKNTGDLPGLCSAINKGGIPCSISADIEKDLWAKMLYNCALNPLGAIFDVPYGILGDCPLTRNLMEEIFREVFCVMKKAGFKTHWKAPKVYSKIFYAKLLPSTAKHRSSMLQDIQAKKTTEIEALNGLVIRLADKYKIPVPVNRAVYHAIKFIEEENLKQQKNGKTPSFPLTPT